MANKQEPQPNPAEQSNGRPWPITFFLANVDDNPASSNPAHRDERFKLIKPLIKHDVILLQENTICEELEGYDELITDYYKAIEQNKAGILLKKNKFGMEPDDTEQLQLITDVDSILSGAELEGQEYDEFFKKQLQEGRMCIVKATLTERNDSILLVSYHGPNRNESVKKKRRGINFDDYGEIYTNFIKNWRLIQDTVGAQHLVIGGDFNFPVQQFREKVPYHEHGLSVYSQVNRTEHRKEAERYNDIIDYFVVSKSLELVECVMAQRVNWDPTLVDDANKYFDHDPVVARFTVSACSTDPLTHMMRNMFLLSGPTMSAKAHEAANCDMQRAHFAAILEELRAKSKDGEWEDYSAKELCKILHNKDEIESLDINELKVILEYLKINAIDAPAAEKEELINATSDIRSRKLTDPQVKHILLKLKKVVPKWDSETPDRKLLKDTLKSREKLRKLNNEELASILTYSQCQNPYHEMLVNIVYQVYQLPLCKAIHEMHKRPSYDELLDECHGLNGLNISM